MTDFLTDLIERSRGPGSGLAPRIPSVFEPATGAVLGPAGDGALPAARPQRSRQAAAWPEGQNAAPSRETAPPAPAPPPEPTLEPALEPALEPMPGPARIPARAGSDGEIGPPGGPAILPAGTVPPQAEAIGGTERVLAEVAVPRAVPAGRRPGLAWPQADAVSPRGEQRGTHARPVARATQVAPHEHTAEGRGSGDQPRSGPLPDGVPLPDGGPLPPPRPGMLVVPRLGAFAAPPERPGPAAPAEPVVHVTIGRVEIRAISAPAPPARRAQAARMMNLDEYLADRNQRRQA